MKKPHYPSYRLGKVGNGKVAWGPRFNDWRRISSPSEWSLPFEEFSLDDQPIPVAFSPESE